MSQPPYPNKGQTPPPYAAPQAVPQTYPPQGAPQAYPPPGAAAPPPAAAVYVQPAPPPPQPEKKKSLIGSFMKEVDKVGKTMGKEIDKAAKKINETVDKNYSSSLLDLFKHGNVIQLVSRTTGHTVNIVMGVAGQLIVDGNGPLDPNAFNSLFTVINEGNNQVRLQNYNNYIAIIDGETRVVNVPPGTVLGLETKFQLIQTGQFVYLESLHERGRYVGFIPTGEVKPALATAKEQDTQFGIKLVSTPYPVVTPSTSIH